VPANGVKNGDIWTRPVSAGNPTAVTSVRTAGAWVVGTPSIPASSRTFIQNTTPIGAASGDLWVDSSTTGKNTVFAFDGTSWINTRAGNKTTIGNTAPATPGVGDSWVDTSVTGTPANKIWDGTNWVIAGGTTAVSTQPAGSFIYQTPTALNGVTLSFGSNYPRQYVRIKGFLRPISEGGDILMYPHFKAPHEWDAADIANESWLAASYGSGGASTSPSRAVNANGATGFKLNAGTDAMWLKANNTVMYSLDFINDGINWNFMWNSTYRCSNDTPIMNMAGASIPVTTDFQEIVFNFVSVHSGGTVVNNTALGKFIVEWQ
jgi:hypothetical protein